MLHLAFGSPAGRPTVAHIEAALDELGAPVRELELTTTNPADRRSRSRGWTTVRAVAVRVYGRDAADTQLVGKLWRSLAYKDSGPTWTVTRLQQVEHEALCLLRGTRRRRRRPRIVAAGVAGPSAALLAYDRTERRRAAGAPRTDRRAAWADAVLGHGGADVGRRGSRTARSTPTTSWSTSPSTTDRRR